MSSSERRARQPEDVLAWLMAQAQAWILAQRAEHRPHSSPIAAAVLPLFTPFFGEDVLGRARFREVPSIENPPFLAAAVEAGVPAAIDFTQMSGITFQDTVLLSRARPHEDHAALLFHELVHVVQYDVLGVAEFTRQYVGGLAAGGFDYDAIPVEGMAFALQARFERDRQTVFAVLDEVRRHLSGGA
jgi:hypothetical protein